MKQNTEWHNWEAKEHSTCPLDDLTTPVEVEVKDGRILNAGSGQFVWSTNISMGNIIVAWRYLICQETPVPVTDDMKPE